MLLLFDIDGTLLRGAAEEHRVALEAAVREVFGAVPPPDVEVELAGCTDLQIMRSIAALCDVDSGTIDAGLPEARLVAAQEYARLVPADLTHTVPPGIAELLDDLSRRADHTLSLVTGNLEPIARLKLHAAGIAAFFAPGQGGFGSDHEDRTMLPAIARARAGDGCEAYPRERTVVIGDTPRDIACARADGVRVIGVAGGPYPADALAEADVVVGDALGIAGALDSLR